MEDARQLILQAFEQAKASGKSEWYRMTIAVLKNRLLNLTHHKFHEATYGASTFGDFVAGHTDLVHIDNSQFPPVVELRAVGSETLAPGQRYSPSARPRVRSDLWRAALDYSSGTQYVWDVLDGQARPRQPGDSSPIIECVDQDVLLGWRKEFIDKVVSAKSVVAEENELVDVWVDRQLPTSYLPRHLISPWNGFLRDKVHRHLLKWFEESGLSPPGNLIASSVIGQRPQLSSDSEELRQLILRVVRRMTADELAELKLPPKAVLRVVKSLLH